MSTYNKLVGATTDGLLPPAVLAHLSTPENSPTASTNAVEYWVSPTGDDGADGSNATPFLTIARAVATIPDVIRAGHTHTITLMAGDWNERLDLKNRVVLGTLIVQGATVDRYAHTIRDAFMDNVQGHLIIRNIHSSKTVPGVHFRFNASGPRMELDNVSGSGEVTSEPHSSGNQGVLADFGSSVHVTNSKFDYKDYGVRANYGSRLLSHNNTGTGNTIGAGARFGGHLEIDGTMIHGYAATTSSSSGGTIAHGSGGYVGVQKYSQFLDKYDTPGLVGQLSTQGSGDITPVKKWVSRDIRTRQGSMGNGGGTIPDGSKLRIYFQMTTDTTCATVIEVTAVWIPIGLSGNKYVKTILVPTIYPYAASATPTLLAYSGSGANSSTVTLGHSGANGIFYLDFTPAGGSSNGAYGLDIQMSNMRHLDAPIMLGAEVLAA